MLLIRGILLAILLTTGASAQFNNHANLSITVQSKGSATFTGVADQETTINHFWGTVAAGSAAAAANKTVFDVCFVTGCSTANSCVGVKALSTGQADTGTGLYCGNGTTAAVATVNAACANSTFGSTTNCIHGGTARISNLYDQIGSNNSAPASYAVATDFVLSAFNSYPAFGCVASRSTHLQATITALSAGYGVGFSFEQTANFGPNVVFVGGDSSANLGSDATNEMYSFHTLELTATATNGTGPSDFSHGHRVIWTSPNGSGTQILYVDGSLAATSSTVTGSGTGTGWGICNANFPDAYITAMWTDPTVPSSAVAEAATNLTTVPLP